MVGILIGIGFAIVLGNGGPRTGDQDPDTDPDTGVWLVGILIVIDIAIVLANAGGPRAACYLSRPPVPAVALLPTTMPRPAD
jgi:hypothetical protein